MIVTADDFGLADEVNEAVERAHVEGILTAASLMVGAPAAARAVKLARRLPTLAVGLHLALVDAEPVLPPSVVPDLIDGRGRFRADMARSGAAMFFLPHVRRQMRAEVRAQFEAFRATGLTLDHVTAHKHFYLHPSILSAVIELAKEQGTPAIRAPLEPSTILARVEAARHGLMTSALAPFSRLQRAHLRRVGIVSPDQVFGLAWSGAMNSVSAWWADRAFAERRDRNIHASGYSLRLRWSGAGLSLRGRTCRPDVSRSSPSNHRGWN